MSEELAAKPMQRVQFMHFRCFRGSELEAKGGMTVCYWPIKESDTAVIAAAICSPKDNFKKKTGRFCSVGRAQKHFIDFYNEKDMQILPPIGENVMHDVHGVFVKKMTMTDFAQFARNFASAAWDLVDVDNPGKFWDLGSIVKNLSDTQRG